MKNIAIDTNNELLEHLRGIDIPDCKKYKDLLESKDKEVIRLAIELLIVDGVDKHQIMYCRERFLHKYHGGQKGLKNIVCNEPRYNNCFVSIMI